MTAIPTVSVVIPCHNHGRYLNRAVRSVLAQTFDDWELVIVDDGSTDDSALISDELIRTHPERRMRLIRQENRGAPSARNTGIRATQGRYVLPLDTDDVIAPEMLEATVAVLDEHADVAIAYTDPFLFVDDAVTPIPYLPRPEYDPRLLLEQCIMLYCSLYRRGAWVTVGGYDETMLGAGEDWDFWIACAEHGLTARRVARPLFGYHHKPAGLHVTGLLQDLALRAKLVANHPALFDPCTVAWANAVLDPESDPRTDPRIPQEILSRSAEMDALIRAVLELQHIAVRQQLRLRELHAAH